MIADLTFSAYTTVILLLKNAEEPYIWTRHQNIMAANANTESPKNGTKLTSQFLNPATGHYIKRDAETGQILGVKRDGMPYKGIRVEESAITYKPNPVVNKATARKAEKAVLSVLNRKAIE